MKNARFWVFQNAGWVKLTLRPEQSLTWGFYARTEEGYHGESHTWTHVGEGVERESEYSGRDCDGRHGESHTDFCELDSLDSVPVYVYPAYRGNKRELDEQGAPMARPDWGQKRPTRCYDQFAEAAGY